MPRIIATINGEGFQTVIRVGDNGIISFKADADICADGANGQNGKPAAYRSDDKGTELLANGGMGLAGKGKVIFSHQWGMDVGVVGPDGNPLVINGAVISKTAYRYFRAEPATPEDNLKLYLDAETVPYVVVPVALIKGVKPVVMGCHAFVSYNGKRVAAVVGDVGPVNRIGEISIELARRLGIPDSPRNGGIDTADVEYEICPGKNAVLDVGNFQLVPYA